MTNAEINILLQGLFQPRPPALKVYKKGWNAERAERERQRCLKNKPSRFSTGPRTAEGKQIVGQNNFKHGKYSRVMKDINHLVCEAQRINKNAQTSQ